MSSNSNTPSINGDETNAVDNKNKNSIAIANMSKSNEFILKNRKIGSNSAYSIAQKIRKIKNIEKIDISDNSFQDEGVIYLSLAIKNCYSLASLNISKNYMTHYGLRILLENVNMSSLRKLDISGNPIGNNGMEYLGNFLEMTDSLETLNLSSINLEEDGAKKLGIALSLNASLKSIDLSWNHIRSHGAALLAKGLGANTTIEEIDLSYNGFSIDGALAMSEVIKYNKTLKVIDLSCNRLSFECAQHLANALKVNMSLRRLILHNNPLTTSGVYHLLNALNTETSNLSYLGLKGVAMLKHVYVIIELIQQKRQFICESGPTIIYSDTLGTKMTVEDDPMLKLSKFLIEKRLRLIDMFRILDKKQMLRMEKEEFMKRLRIFEPRLKNKEILTIADSLSDGNVIEYSNLFRQVHQTKQEIIAQENSIIKLKLQALKKNKGYLKNIDNQFSGLLQNKRPSVAIIEDWLNEDEEEDAVEGSKPVRRSSKIIFNGRNSIYASLTSTANSSDFDSENNKTLSQSLVNINNSVINRRRLSLISKSITGSSLPTKSVDNTSNEQSNNSFKIDEEKTDSPQHEQKSDQQVQKENLKSKSNAITKITELSPISLTKSSSTANIKKSNQTPRHTYLKRKPHILATLNSINNFEEKKLQNIEVKN